MRAALAALLLLALLAPGAHALGAGPVRVEAPSAAPEALLQAAEALALPAAPLAAPAAVVQAAPPLVEVVQPVLAPLAPVLAPAADAPEPAVTPEDLAAIAAQVEAARLAAAPAPVPEPYQFPRDEPVPPWPALAPVPPAPVAESPPESAPSAAAPAGVVPLVPVEAAAGALLLLAAGLYVRLAPSETLASPTRRRVYDAVRADPGCTVNTVARALGIDYKTAQHHLRVLGRGGLVHRERVGGWERYFVTGDLPAAGHARAVLLRAPAARALAQALAQGGRARAVELARALGVSEATASVQLRRLEAAGLVVRGTDGFWAAA